MGIKTEELENVKSVIIELPDKEIIIDSAQVVVVSMKDQKVYQIIVGSEREVPVGGSEGGGEVEISEDDVKFIVEQTGLSEEEARSLLVEARGDLARALILYEERKGGK
jgi:nascent polypeptide-associated complex subunit alpha